LGYKQQRIALAVIVLKLVAHETAGTRSLRKAFRNPPRFKPQ
jgi:hypothetical protein